MNSEWKGLTPEEKRNERFEWWLEPPSNVRFVNSEAEEAYKQRARRFIDAYCLREPDRVPVMASVAAIPAYLYGSDSHTVMYDYQKMADLWAKFNGDHASELDTFVIPTVVPAKVYDLLDFRLYAYAGRGLPTNAPGVQFVEREYMKADEYDALIRDPSDFWIRVYLPRVYGALEPFNALAPFTDLIEMPGSALAPFMRPDVQNALQSLIDAGKELAKRAEKVRELSRHAIELGYPLTTGGAFCKAPFDTLGDTMRGTKGIMMDMYRQPDKLLEAMDVIADISVQSAVSFLNASRGFKATFPLHKGADGWMSDDQFNTFYWPPLKKVIDGLAKEGVFVVLFAEGSFNTRLERVDEFERGAVSWLFDRTDMAKAKKVLGDTCCIMGNVPASLMVTGSAADVKEYCKGLIETCGKGGGFVLSPGSAAVDEAKLENIRAMVEAAKEYGVYRG
jgi:uroporphyrinogen-III decarboxylase